MPMNVTVRLLPLLLVATLTIRGAEWFVAPDATLSGNGSKPQPWQMQVALTNTSSVKPGDTVSLRAGTYSNDFTAGLSGTNAAPIIFRNYNRERAIIEGSLTLEDSTYLWIWGLEFIDS